MNTPTFRSLFAVALASLGSAHAQNVPDAGAIRQQIEQDQHLPVPAPQAPVKPSAPAAPKERTGPLVTIREFRFSGNTLLSAADLQMAVRDYRDRELDFDELQQAAQAVAARYRDAGWIVQSFLPRQDITDGVVTIEIVEARFGTVQRDGEAPERLREGAWRAIVDAAQPAGEPLSAKALDRALLLIDDLPGVLASGSLASGERPGETDLVLKLSDEPLFSGTAGFDNHGARSTGKNRLTATLGVNSPAGLGDRLLANLIHADGNDYGRLAYTLPVGGSGLRVGANVSNLDYRLVSSQFSALAATGSSLTLGLEASYPLLRSRAENLYLSASFDNKAFNNEANGTTTSKYTANVAGIGLVANRYDEVLGGANEASLFLSAGRVSPEGNAPRTDRSDGDFAKIRWNLSRQQVITEDLTAYAGWSGQWSGKNLDSSEKLYLGGPNGVRAYPANEGGGTTGHLINLELRQRVLGDWQLTGFLDYGRIRQYANNLDTAGHSLTSGNVSNQLSYQGYGVSLSWRGPFGSQVVATWARRLGSNPNPTVSGKDQDGTLDRDRLWLSLSVPFEFTPKVVASPAVAVATLPPPVVTVPPPAEALPEAVAEVDDSIEIDPEKKALTLRRRGNIWLVVADDLSVATANQAVATVNMVEEWRSAWVSREATRYLNYYADEFRPDSGLTREQWQKQRRQRLKGSSQITLELSEQRIRIDGDTATVSFKQHYSTPSFTETAHKTLTLKRIGAAWQIVSEHQQTPRP